MGVQSLFYSVYGRRLRCSTFKQRQHTQKRITGARTFVWCNICRADVWREQPPPLKKTRTASDFQESEKKRVPACSYVHKSSITTLSELLQHNLMGERANAATVGVSVALKRKNMPTSGAHYHSVTLVGFVRGYYGDPHACRLAWHFSALDGYFYVVFAFKQMCSPAHSLCIRPSRRAWLVTDNFLSHNVRDCDDTAAMISFNRVLTPFQDFPPFNLDDACNRWPYKRRPLGDASSAARLHNTWH